MPATLFFGQWLRARRRALDLTQEELSRQITCSLETIQKIEGGSRRPSKQVAELLASALHIGADEREEFLRFARGEHTAAPWPLQNAQQTTTATYSAEPNTKQRPEPPNNLHIPLTPFIGRQGDVAAVRDYLFSETTRLLTLMGPPGIGKTRLSIEVARAALTHFVSGVFFVPLASIDDPCLVVAAISETLGMSDVGGQSSLSKLVEFLQNRELLLVLDNFEQVVSAGPEVADLLQHCPGVKALVTSREALYLHGEQQFPVPPLRMPASGESLSLEELSTYPAIALFVDRAKGVEPSFALTEENTTAVSAICTALDGLPLAIELVAARTKVLPPQALLSKLNNRLELVTGRSRDAPSRHRSLRAAIDWSYNLLDTEEQTLFRRLSIFAGGYTLSAVEAICNPTGDLKMDALDGLASLLDKSLLYELRGAGVTVRYTMLETIREYATERLDRSGETANLNRSHAEYYLSLAEGTDASLGGSEQKYFLDVLEAEHNNIRAALAWSLDHNEVQLLVRLSSTLWYFWYTRRYFTEGRRWLEAALAMGATLKAQEQGPVSVSPNAWATAHMGAGLLAYYQGDHARAWELQEASLALYQELGEKRGAARVLNNLGNLARDMGYYERAEAFFAQCLPLYKEIGVIPATVLNNWGLVAYDAGNWERARQLFGESLQLRRKLGKEADVAFSLHCLGEVARQLGDTEAARGYYDESLAFFNKEGDKRSIAMNLHGLGMLAVTGGDETDLQAAASLIRESLSLRRELGERRLFAWDFEGLAAVAHMSGDTGRAAKLLGAAHTLRKEIGLALPPADLTLRELTTARVCACLGEEAFRQSWAEGEQMTTEQAIGYALGDERVEQAVWSGE